MIVAAKSKMNLLKGLLFSALVILAAVILVKVTHDRRVQRDRRVTLPQGTVIEFLGTAVGGAMFSTEKPWERTVRRYLPARLTRWIPAPETAGCGSGSNTLTVFVRATIPAGLQPGQREWLNYSATDESGLQYHRESGYCSFGATSNTMIYGFNLRAFPRRQESFAFNFLGEGHTNMGTIRVPNLFRGPFPSWNPEPLPQTRSNGPVTLTLKGLKMRETSRYRYYRPEWDLESTEPPWVRSKARYAEMSDPTGNEGNCLSPEEPAWKLRALVYRERAEDFRPDEQMVLTNIALPGAAAFQVIDQAALCNQVSFRVRILAGPGCLYLTNGTTWFMEPNEKDETGSSTRSDSTATVQRWASTQHFVMLETLGTLRHDEVQMHIEDQDGRKLNSNYNGWQGAGNGSRTYRFMFTPEPATTHVTVTARLSRPLEFEFLIDPKAVKVLAERE